MQNIEQAFLNDLEKKLWTAANKLLPSLDAAVYKHVVLGLVFLKYVSDAFEERQEELRDIFQNEADDNLYALLRGDYDSDEAYQQALAEELEQRDYYIEKNVFWVPQNARWSSLQKYAKLPANTELWQDAQDNPVKMRSVAWLIDTAMEAIERENPKLKGILNKNYTTYQIIDSKLGELIDLFSDAHFHAKTYKGQPLEMKSKDILGHVYEYFLGEFALAEGKKGGQYYTPKSIVSLIVEMLEPYEGRVYDPAMGSGGFFVQSEKFIEKHARTRHYNAAEQKKRISVYGQESNPTTWRLAAMNMAIRGIDFNFGSRNADTFNNDQHPDLRADFVMANPPFNMKEWWSESLADDVRWQHGTPPAGNANFAWLMHMLHHLAPTGSMGLLLANGSMSSSTSGEGEIRKALLQADLIECMVALPGQLFTNTQIPACIWFLTKDKGAHKGKRDRKGEVLFIDARQLGYMKDRVLRDFTEEDIQQVSDTFHGWQKGEGYADQPGYCYAATLDEIEKHDFVLTPGRYVGAPEEEADDEPFAEKMERLTAQLAEQFAESATLEAEIKQNLAGLGYSL